MKYNRANLVHTFKSQQFAGKIFGDRGTNQLVLNAKPYFQHFLNTKCKPGEEVTLSVTNKKPKRTVSQNNYYWLYLNQIAGETGNQVEDLHKLFKGKFLGSEVVEVFGEKVRREQSTTDLSVTDFGEYIDKIAAFTEIQPPPPDNFGIAWPLTPVRK